MKIWTSRRWERGYDKDVGINGNVLKIGSRITMEMVKIGKKKSWSGEDNDKKGKNIRGQK